ncbi:CinA family protein [Pseudooctadecabacter jejudonensis]|uniref:Nicotinamide-nucleotide amidohydrolase PncC n=1 Tax=Pseudooctadecabacter jejudonensis TaxID=1391910 RepID=A0A1Y5RIV4_9RHOB|nr:CinA family protein [Pseudooctadecabacter jejudonensis]SLN15743.1 Nicotinamide-nucleotide amidohydrolase PncC [Pseudooctadecabacter jejudonensis]
MSAAALIEALKARGWMMATAESCTGGLIAAAVTDVAGSSAVFDRGFITYSNEAKMHMVGVSQGLLISHGAVSEPVARAMAAGALARSDAQIAVSVTGIAGPGGSDHKPEGRVCFGLATAQGVTAQTVEFGPLGRAEVRQATVDHALSILLRASTY